MEEWFVGNRVNGKSYRMKYSIFTDWRDTDLTLLIEKTRIWKSRQLILI